jgi:hypothetical protein
MQQNENNKENNKENDKNKLYNNNNKLYSNTIIQGRLTKSEWNNMEIPVSPDELAVIKLIRDGYHNVQLKFNSHSSMIGILKTSSSPEMHAYLYQKHFEQLIQDMVNTFQLDPHFSCDADTGTGTVSKKTNKVDSINSSKKSGKYKTAEIKKVDAIRIKNNEVALSSQSKNIFENTILKICKLLLVKKVKWNKEIQSKNVSCSHDDSDADDDNDIDGCSWMSYYYALKMNLKNSIEHVNTHVTEFVTYLIEMFESDVDVGKFIQYAEHFVEKNHLCTKFKDMELYDHQKQIFTHAKTPNPKLVLYIAPTGTGKTLTPIGLSEKHKIIFVCAARHVGLALAKSAISIQKRIAFAFGCKSVDDIRLHYFAAKEATRDWRTGGIRKVDNSIGDNVDIMICDIQSYLHAMFYMKAFHPVENIILFWDEPTITMDCDAHEYHDIIHKNWKQNIIPNVVLSSATLPHDQELQSTIADFKSRFSNAEVVSIVSHDCSKSIPIVSKGGCVQLPHTLFPNYADVLLSATHCEKNKTLLRYFGVGQICDFISFVNRKQYYSSQRYSVQRYFSSLDEITHTSIKLYYLVLLKNITQKPEVDAWTHIYNHFKDCDDNLYESTGYITTSDAHTLTDGPTIFLTNDVEKIASFCLQTAQIPAQLIDDIMDSITHNNKLSEQIETIEKRIEDLLNEAEKGSSVDNESKDKKNNFLDKKMESGEIKQLNQKLQLLNEQVKRTALHDLFIPNRNAHLEKWCKDKDTDQNKKPWSCDIQDSYVEKIMLLPIESHWKILLLMGIGAITDHKNAAYNEIMKELAQDQKLFLIIASSDYIYGTNYQFCHGYIGRDLHDMTQEKTIQAMGRVGRNSIQQDYTIRFRDDGLIQKLFLPSTNKLEADNMNRLFSSF